MDRGISAKELVHRHIELNLIYLDTRPGQSAIMSGFATHFDS